MKIVNRTRLWILRVLKEDTAECLAVRAIRVATYRAPIVNTAENFSVQQVVSSFSRLSADSRTIAVRTAAKSVLFSRVYYLTV